VDKGPKKTAAFAASAYRAWHAATQEADLMIGGFFNRHGENWTEAEIAWFERLMEEQDVDIMAWAIGTQPVAGAFQGEMMSRMQQLVYIDHPA
jgi:antitoxin CptB